MKESLIINSSYVTPGKYKIANVPVKERFWIIFKKIVGWRKVISVKGTKKKIDVTSDDWERTKILANRRYPIIIFEDEQGKFSPVSIRRINGEYTQETMDTDKWRDFEKYIKDVHERTKNKWSKFMQVAVIGLLTIFSVAVVIMSVYFMGDFSTKHATALAGFFYSNFSNMTPVILGG